MKGINVYSEIGKLRKVLVHRPGDELKYVTPQRIDELLMSAIIEVEQAQKEHDEFTSILKKQGVEVVELADLFTETYKKLTPELKEKFVKQWMDEAPLKDPNERKKVDAYLKEIEKKSVRKMTDKMMAGILYNEIGMKSKTIGKKVKDLVVDPMPNIYFTRDPFASVGNGITLHKMKYKTRQRETIFSQWIFEYHPEYAGTPMYYDRKYKNTVEGGDIFIYSRDVLAIGVSERTGMDAIKQIAYNIAKNEDCKFEKILCINVPPMGNLMHLDTWLTMLDKTTFLYSGNIFGVLKIWEIDIAKSKKAKSPKDIKPMEKNDKLENVLSKVVGKKVTMVPIGGKDALQMDIDIETHFDGTNYLAIAPGVVIGYHRNRKTQLALEKAGVKVLSFNGNQLSLGMGSARCMSMPLWRDDLK